MFRSLFFNKRNIVIGRAFSDRKLPGVVWTESFLNSSEKIGTKSEFKEYNPNWKATKGDGKSIFDCENEKWCEPKDDEKSVRTYKKIYSDDDKAPEWIEINIGPEWVEPNLRED